MQSTNFLMSPMCQGRGLAVSSGSTLSVGMGTWGLGQPASGFRFGQAAWRGLQAVEERRIRQGGGLR